MQQKSPLIAGQPSFRSNKTYDSSDVILAFIDSDEEDANERPNATLRVSHVTGRSKLTSTTSTTTIAQSKILNLFKNLRKFSMSKSEVQS